MKFKKKIKEKHFLKVVRMWEKLHLLIKVLENKKNQFHKKKKRKIKVIKNQFLSNQKNLKNNPLIYKTKKYLIK